MSDVLFPLPGGGEVSLAQAVELARLTDVAGKGNSHWHFNECGCCVTLHGPDYAYVIGRDGEATFFADRGCNCGEHQKISEEDHGFH
jgi:hypothetical protein